MRFEGCGYDSCPCRGVHFISRYRDETDYCVNGKRLHITDGKGPQNGTPDEQEILRLGLLDEYAKYLTWRGEWLRPRFPDYEPEHSPIALWEVNDAKATTSKER